MISVDEINNLQETIDSKNRIITVLKKTVKQWVKEYNILDGIIDIKDVEIQKLNDIIDSYQPRLQKYKDVLQEIKTIAENAYCLTNYTNKDMADFAKQILQLIIKAEEE